MVHCHWEHDARTAMQLVEAVAPIKPFWFEDPLQPEWSPRLQRLYRVRNSGGFLETKRIADSETVTGKGDWMDQVLALDRPHIKGGMIELSSKPGLGWI